MGLERFLEALYEAIGMDDICLNEPMKNHTSFKIGGEAKILVEPSSVDHLKKVMMLITEMGINYHIIGNGSNLLVKDGGFNGVIVKISDKMNAVRIDGEAVYAEAGILLSTLSKRIMENSLTGFEFASGIPGTLGGAVFMNAGAYGGEMKDIVQSVIVMDKKGKVFEMTNGDLRFGYRSSSIQDNDYIVLEAKMKFEKGCIDEIKATTNDLTKKRTTKQPLSVPSAGSTFKRPEGHFAGQLIEESGLRGIRHGGAMVSDLHCGFVVNTGDATAKDVLELISTIKKIVLDNFSVELEPEVRVIGED